MAGANPNHGLPRVQADANKLNNFEKIWDGYPFSEFRLQFWDPFRNALSGSRVDGYTLLDCLDGNDPGGAHHAIPAAATAANLMTQHRVRNRCLANVIMQHISHTSGTYRIVLQNFPADGVSAALYILTPGVGPIALTSGQINALESDWLKMDMATFCNNEYSENSLQKWADHVNLEGDKFTTPKTNQERASKFIDGLVELAKRQFGRNYKSNPPALLRLTDIVPVLKLLFPHRPQRRRRR